MKIDGVDVHPDVNTEAIVAAVKRRLRSLDNPGFCIACGIEAEGCEPDARQYECEVCHEACVYGADELLFCFVA
jgi:hypothetical protein